MRVIIRERAAYPAGINSDAGVVLTVYRTAASIVVDNAEVVVASDNNHISPNYDRPEEGEVYVVAPRVYGPVSATYARKLWRRVITLAIQACAPLLPPGEE